MAPVQLFPQYRKYPNGLSYFKLISADHFLEVQVMGSRKILHEVKATIHPERMRIQDMLTLLDGLWEVSTETEFEQAAAGAERL